MLGKLLSLALCTLILVPQRICTCMAEISPCTERHSSSRFETESSVAGHAGCQHLHHDRDQSEDPNDGPRIVEPVSDSSIPPAEPHQHHRSDCPAVTALVGLESPKPECVRLDSPAGGELPPTLVVKVSPACPAHDRESARPTPRSPLFLLFHVLRN